MSNEAGGEDAVGHSYKDHMNLCYKLKIKAIEGGHSQVVYDKLQDAYYEDPNFFFRIRLDKDVRVCNLFWRDSMMVEDYKIYGDVTVFDTTYRTNRYNLICAPLGDKSPITLFTDQDAAMARTIKKIFPTTRHRLCVWHLMQNAVTRFGVLKSDSTFKADFNKCLSGCLNEAEFNTCWEAMVIKYNLKEHKWFIRIYKLRHKWARTLSKDFFSARILSSQRSESTNNIVGFRATKKTSLTEFYHIFQETIKSWRRKKYTDEFNTTKSIPTSHYPMTSLLKHAAQVYTHTLFRDFEEEFNLVVASQKYISSRWTKFAKVEVWNKHEAQLKAKGLLNSFTPWRLHMMRKYYSLILKSHTIKEARKIIDDNFKKDSEVIQTIVAAASNNEHNTTNTTTENETSVQVLDSAHANTKGKSKKMIPGSYDNFNKGKRRKHREFGSKTPKHLL
ncbi:protein FAR1-RELATED SEQUENCE 5-like [Spinacia oleracea]|uniref:Protein FAR1-RELATED SEQUENCE 5-like n=1 Tax=Spinacia oleracea TaxID=3562 RepID=A0ABM3R3U0_SPIOL|nr:protein FAR1-RELATED SEQUENCE 5-like [Spinacia oleracea]